MRILISLLAALVFTAPAINAQLYYPVTHTSGTQSIGNRNVTVTATQNPTTFPTVSCTLPANTYYIGAASNHPGYKFAFSLPVTHTRFHLAGMNNGEVISFIVNGSQYNLTTANLSIWTGGCASSNTWATQNGMLIVQGTGTVTNVQVDINPGYGIDSIRIHHWGQYQGGGVLHDFAFAADTIPTITQPFNDTVKCAGDSLYVPFTTTNVFNSNNVFTLQLSNAAGSFAVPANLGTLSGTAGGTFGVKLPAAAVGSGYRIRIVSSSPARVSADNGKNILIKALPVPVAGSNSPVCVGGTISLSSGASGATSFSWTGPGSFTSGQQNTSVTNATSAHAGDYIVTATANGCSGKDTVTVAINPLPATPTAGNNGPLCEGDTLQLTASSATAGVSYSWLGPLVFGSGLQNPVINGVVAGNAGVYSVTATLNGCSSAPGTTTLVIKPTPATPSASSNSPVCAGGVLNLTAGSATPGATYTWSGPGGFSSGQQNPSLSPVTSSAAGTYSVQAELNGCLSAVGTTSVTVNNVSSLGVYPSPNDTLCINSPNATFVAVPFNAGTSPQYQWYKNGTIVSGATNISYPSANIADGDTFQCRMVVTGQCPQALTLFSNKIGMTVLPMTSGPSVTITADPPGQLKPWQLVKFTAVAANAGTDPKYQWKRNGQNVAGATSFTWSANNLSHNDTVTCEVTSSTWCANPPSAQSNRIDVNVALGIGDVAGANGIRLYPNPNNGTFVLDVASNKTAAIEVINAIGQIVHNEVLGKTGENAVALPQQLPAGNYIIRVKTADIVKTERFSINR